MTHRRPHKKTARGVAIDGDVSGSAIITGDHNVIQISAPADPVATALHQVPPPPADFTGRKDDLEELLVAIEQGGVTISGLHGLGGIGKTALALKLVEELKSRYPDAQFYLDLKGASTQPLSVTEALAHVVRAYHPTAKLPDSEVELRSLYLSVLDRQRALLLMDNAAGAEQVEPLIPPAGCVLLVTSRQHFTLPGLAAKNLDTLTADDARALLLAIAPRIGGWADEIAKLCGCLPLALRLAAGALAKYRNLKPVDYARRLRGTQQRLKLIEASLSLSYELLSEELRERWRWLVVFTDSFADDAAASVWEVTIDEAQNTLGALIAASMVEWNEINGRYRLHDLARLFAEAKLSAEEHAAGKKRHATHYKDVLSHAEALYLRGSEALVGGLALFDLEWGNIQAAQGWVARQSVEGDEDVTTLAMKYPGVGAHLLHLRQHPREQIIWHEVALAAARRLKDRVVESGVIGNLGIAYVALGETQRSIEFFEQALLTHRELADSKGEALALGHLGIAYAILGETEQAIQCLEQQLIIVRKLDDRRGEGVALGNLGNVYVELGDSQRAIELHEHSLLIDRELGDRRGEGTDLTNLGNAYGKSGEVEHAIQLYEQALFIFRNLGDRRGEGNTLWNMSLAMDQLGECSAAIRYAEQSLTILEQIEDPDATKVRAKLAEWRKESGA